MVQETHLLTPGNSLDLEVAVAEVTNLGQSRVNLETITMCLCRDIFGLVMKLNVPQRKV